MKKHFIFMAVLGLVLCTSCSDPIDISTSDDPIVLHHDEEYSIVATSQTPITYSSSNEYCAVVNQDGLITARCIGESTIQLSNGKDTKSIVVKVEPLCTKYELPAFQYGQSKASFIEQYGEPILTEEMDEIEYLIYSSFPTFSLIMFAFDQNEELVLFSPVDISGNPEELATFVAERYLYYKEHTAHNGVEGSFYINALNIDEATEMVFCTISEGMYMAEFGTPEYMNSDQFEAKKASAQKLLRNLK